MFNQEVTLRRLFAANIRRREERIDLALAALLIAKEEYSRLVIEDYIERLDLIAGRLAVEIDLEAKAESVALTIVAFLCHEEGFDGAGPDNYYDARNSYLNEVMDRRIGIPITLSLTYMEVARRAGLTLMPVAMPAHFLVRLSRGADQVYIDPFNSGQVLDVAGCQRIYENHFGDEVAFSESFLGAATKRQVISRILRNLKSVYLRESDFERALRCVDLLMTVTPWGLDELRDRGFLRYRLGHLEEAVSDLQTYTQHAPPGPELETVRKALRRIGGP